MKKLVLGFIAVLFFYNSYSQCTPLTPTGNPGLTPDPVNVPCIDRGVYYETILYFENFSSFSCGGFTADVTSSTIDNMSNFPCGLSWQADKSSYGPGETGCIRIYGTTTDPVGEYPLTVEMTYNLSIFGSPYSVSGTLAQLQSQLTQFGCTAPSVNTDYFSRVRESGNPCPAIGVAPTQASSGAVCPTLGVTISGVPGTPLCEGSSAILNADVTGSVGFVTYQWAPGGDTSPSITVSPTSTTTYSVTVTDQNGTATASVSLPVNQNPSAFFTANTSGLTATITNTSLAASSYLWDFGDGQTSTAQNPGTHTYNTGGTYTITLVAADACATDTATLTITVTSGSAPSVTISGVPGTPLCEGSSATLTANTTNANGTVTYLWSQGGTSQSIIVSPTSTTIYSVTITAQNGTATASTSLPVNQAPRAAFTATPSGTSVSINNTTQAASTYLWNFGDGQTSTSQNPPAHTYPNNGTYTITLIATDVCSSDTATQTVTITGGSGPSVTISGNTSVCAGTSTQLIANASNTTGNVSYAWSNGGNTAAITVTPNNTTTYTVTVTAGNGTVSAFATVTVNSRPTAAFTATPSGTAVSLNNTTTSATSYAWNFGNGQTSTAQNPGTQNYTNNGTYTITLIASNTCGSDTATQAVTITGGSGPSVTISGNTTVCAGTSTQLTANASNTTGNVSYAWSNGGNTAAITITPSNTITYTVTVTAGNGTVSGFTTVMVNPKPNAAFSTNTSGTLVSFTNTTTSATSYSWNFGDGQTGTGQTPAAHNYTSNGTFTITLIATNSCGSDTATQNVTITGGSGPSVSIAGNTTVCAGTSTTLTANVSNATGSVTYVWTPGNFNGQVLTVSPSATTTYSVAVTAQNGTASATATVTISTGPTAFFSASITGATVTINNATTGGATSYAWNFGNGQTSALQNPGPYAYTSNGTFTIVLEATNACGTSTATQSVNVVGVGIEDVANSIGLQIYPNPFDKTTTIEVENLAGDYHVTLYTVTGLKVFQQNAISNRTFVLERNTLPAGVYFIEVGSEKFVKRKKVIIY